MWYGLERGADMSAYAGTAVHLKRQTLQHLHWSIGIYYLAQDTNWDWSALSYAGFETALEEIRGSNTARSWERTIPT